MLDELIETLSNLWKKERQQLIYQPIDPSCVDRTDDYVPLKYGKHYLRLWLAHVYLAKQVEYLQTWFPVVHSLVRFDLQGQPVAFPIVADASRVGMNQKNETGDVIARNYLLTPLIPFNNGTVELDAGLSAVVGANTLNNLIETLSDFSSLLGVPQFSSALNVAAPLARGLQSLLAMGGLHLALHDTFAERKTGGYLATVRATQQEIPPTDLRVKNDELRLVNQYDHNRDNPLEGSDYLLFRLEVTEQGPDYRSLASIQQPMIGAYQALRDLETAKADGFYRAAVVAAHTAPELTTADRRRVKLELKEDFTSLKNDLGLPTSAPESAISKSVKPPLTADYVLAMGEPSFDELFDV